MRLDGKSLTVVRIRIQRELWTRIRIKALTLGIPVQDYVARILEGVIKDEERRPT